MRHIRCKKCSRQLLCKFLRLEGLFWFLQLQETFGFRSNFVLIYLIKITFWKETSNSVRKKYWCSAEYGVSRRYMLLDDVHMLSLVPSHICFVHYHHLVTQFCSLPPPGHPGFQTSIHPEDVHWVIYWTFLSSSYSKKKRLLKILNNIYMKYWHIKVATFWV